MISAAKNAKRHLMVGHLLQDHPVFIRVLQMVEVGDLGNLLYMYSNRFSLGIVRAEEDVVWSFAPHDISMLLSLAKDNLKSVQCQAFASIQNGIADSATINLTFESSLPILCFQACCYWRQRNGGFDDTQIWENKLALYRHAIDKSQVPPFLNKAKVEYIVVPQAEPLKQEFQYFLDVMGGTVSARTDGIEGRAVLQVLTAASTSMLSGKTVNV